jgi:hypothetical protein
MSNQPALHGRACCHCESGTVAHGRSSTCSLTTATAMVEGRVLLVEPQGKTVVAVIALEL